MKRIAPLSLLALTAIAVGAIFRYPRVLDDPFITYRYARNLMDGAGLVYNAGDRVLSTTTPLYALLLALLGNIYVDIPALGYALSVAGLFACAGFVYLLAARMKYPGSGLLAGAMILLAPGLLITFGLETGMYLALAFGAIYFYFAERFTLAAALFALLTLTRMDGVLLFGIFAVHFVLTGFFGAKDAPQNDKTEPPVIASAPSSTPGTAGPRKAKQSPDAHGDCFVAKTAPRNDRLPLSLRAGAVYVLIVGAWLAFAWMYFGSPFPLTLTAKIAQAQSGLWDSFAVGFGKWAWELVGTNLLLIVFALLGIMLCARQYRTLLLVALWAVVHVAAYSLLGVAFYAWYAAPVVPPLMFFAALGLTQTVAFVTRARKGRPQGSPLRVAYYVLTTIFVVIVLGLELRADLALGQDKPQAKTVMYRQAAEWIAQNVPPDATVDALEVGVIGYYDAHRTMDFVGLIEPALIPYTRARAFADGVRRFAPEVVVAIPPDTWLAEDPWFVAAYTPVQQFTARDFYGGRPLIVYARNDRGAHPRETREVQISFENQVVLEQVGLFAAAEVLPIILHLRTTAPVGKNMKFTLQLLDGDRVVAQSDTFFPARFPFDDQVFRDYQFLKIPREARGEYDLILAMYDAQTQDRAAIFDASGKEMGDFVVLEKTEIGE